jgi:hypothetical protein
MPISEFVAELKADKTYAGAFAAGVGSGSGRPREATRSTSGRPGVAATAEKLAALVKGGADRVGVVE